MQMFLRTRLADGWSLRMDKWTDNAHLKLALKTVKPYQRHSTFLIYRCFIMFHSTSNPSMSHLVSTMLQEPDWEGWAVCHDSAVHRIGERTTWGKKTGKQENVKCWQNKNYVFFQHSQVQLFQVAVGHIPLENRQRAPLCRQRLNESDAGLLQSFRIMWIQKIRERMCFHASYFLFIYNINMYLPFLKDLLYTTQRLAAALLAESLLSPSNPGKAIYRGSLDDHVEPDSCLMLPLPVLSVLFLERRTEMVRQCIVFMNLLDPKIEYSQNAPNLWSV